MAVSRARSAALRILLRVEMEDAFASELLHSGLLDDLSASDRALCTQIVMGVLRWRGRLDHAIAAALGSANKFRTLDPEVLAALRIGAFQLGFLQRIPARAVVNESAELTRQARKASAVPLVNAVLRRLTREPQLLAPAAPPIEDHSADALAGELSHPLWMVERWIARYGFEAARRICEYDQSVPETTLRLNSGDWAAAEAALAAEGIHLRPGEFLDSARRVVQGSIFASPLLQKGTVSVQDEASQLVAHLVGKGTRILDCCAAPGGKTAILAHQNPEAEIVAVEIHPHRARLLERLLHAGNVKVLTADSTRLPASPLFDRVLADVPCSGTGTLARNPEIKWKLQPSDLPDLQQRQIAILEAALARTAPGGRVVYSTCSLEAEECEDVVLGVVQHLENIRPVPCLGQLQSMVETGELRPQDLESLCSGPFLRTLPGAHSCDGFFAAILEKTGE